MGRPMTIASALVILALTTCKANRISDILFSRENEIYTWFEHSRIRLRIDGMMRVKVYRDNGTTEASLTRNENSSTPTPPSHFVISGDKSVFDFSVSKSLLEDIKSHYGIGKRLTLQGSNRELNLEKRLCIELYEEFPDVAFMSAAYENIGTEAIKISKSISNYFIIDESLISSPGELSGFWTFQGSAYKWQKDYIFRLPAGFESRNYFGMNGPDAGGGLPFVDLRSRKCGIAIAHVKPVPVPVSMPVHVRDDNSVEISICEEPEVVLNPGQRFETVNSIVIVHELDFYNPLRQYGIVMKRNLPEYKNPPEIAYKPEWCTWGFRRDFQVNDIIQLLPRIKELGFASVIIDDGWFPQYGDWEPVKSKFPEGETDMKRFIKKLHENDLKVWLWWTPFASVEAGKTWRNNPDWLIHDGDGKVNQSYDLCPAYPPVQEYHRALVKKFVGEWDIDGFKLDFARINAAPPCFNPAHNHQSVWNSYEKVPDIFRIIYETAVSFKRDFLIEYCACGIPPSIYQFPWFQLPVTSDPGLGQVTQRIKMYKALFNPSVPVLEEYCGVLNGPVYELTIGSGGVPGTFSKDLNDYHKKWLKIYDETMLSTGEYLNLYDIAFDFPEAHIIRKDDAFYYAFFSKPELTAGRESGGKREKNGMPQEGKYSGRIHLRGLERSTMYRIKDYEHNNDLGVIKGSDPYLTAEFDTHLLLTAVRE